MFFVAVQSERNNGLRGARKRNDEISRIFREALRSKVLRKLQHMNADSLTFSGQHFHEMTSPADSSTTDSLHDLN